MYNGHSLVANMDTFHKFLVSLYRIALGDLVRRGWPKPSNYGGTWFESHDRIIKMFGSALQSSTPQLVQLIQVANIIFLLSFLLACFYLLSL